MTNQSTIDKLIEMRLTSMADAFRNQLNDPAYSAKTEHSLRMSGALFR